MAINDDGFDEDMVIGTSPCGRWEKRNKQFSLREFPCMLGASLAMDTEEGIEVVWIEILIPYKNECEIDQIKTTLDMVVRYSHPNLVKFHDYWIEDRDIDKYVVFITESLTCGSVTQFIKKSKLNEKPIVLATWRRWCRQILLGIEYLHTRVPPYVLYNLSCDDIFIQHNGLVKIALVHSLCTIDKLEDNANSQSKSNTKDGRSLVIQYRGAQGHRFYADIIAFGKICLYIATLEPCSDNSTCINTNFNTSDNALSGAIVNTISNTNGAIPNTKNLLKKLKTINHDQADFIRICLHSRYNSCPSIIALLNHPILFEMPSLVLICGHVCADNHLRLNADWDDENKDNDRVVVRYSIYHTKSDVTECSHEDDRLVLAETKELKHGEFQTIDIDKYIDEIARGMHPVTCFTQKNNEFSNMYIIDLKNSENATAANDFISSAGATTTTTERTIDLSSQDDPNSYYTNTDNHATHTNTVSSNDDDDANNDTKATTNNNLVHKKSVSSTKVSNYENNTCDVENTSNTSHKKNGSISSRHSPPIQSPPSNKDLNYVVKNSSLNCMNAKCNNKLHTKCCYITQIICHVEPVYVDESQSTNFYDHSNEYYHDSYIHLNIHISDNSILKFIFGFNRSLDSPSQICNLILKYHNFVYDDIIFMVNTIAYAVRYDAPVVCYQHEPPISSLCGCSQLSKNMATNSNNSPSKDTANKCIFSSKY